MGSSDTDTVESAELEGLPDEEMLHGKISSLDTRNNECCLNNGGQGFYSGEIVVEPATIMSDVERIRHRNTIVSPFSNIDKVLPDFEYEGFEDLEELDEANRKMEAKVLERKLMHSLEYDEFGPNVREIESVLDTCSYIASQDSALVIPPKHTDKSAISEKGESVYTEIDCVNNDADTSFLFKITNRLKTFFSRF